MHQSYNRTECHTDGVLSRACWLVVFVKVKCLTAFKLPRQCSGRYNQNVPINLGVLISSSVSAQSVRSQETKRRYSVVICVNYSYTQMIGHNTESSLKKHSCRGESNAFVGCAK